MSSCQTDFPQRLTARHLSVVADYTRHQTGRGLWYRMARNFNWYSEKRMGDRTYGLVTPERLERIKREMERLTEKYDADTRNPMNHALAPVV